MSVAAVDPAALAVLSAGAAKGLVEALQASFRDETGAGIVGTFGAVGAIREQFAGGAACDVLILTAAQLAELERVASVVADTIAPLGRVATGVAVRSGDPHPGIADRRDLADTFGAGKALYCPDPERATAGIHFVNVLRALGLWPGAAERLRAYPSGAIAMRELAQACGDGLVGCTQVTEILYTPGVELVGPLPAPFALETVYSVAVAARSRHPDLARRFAAHLAGPDSRELRERGGLMPA
ncbi:MAG: substrate-binding domain-containing protein [Burkholderiales bacterium]